MTTRRVAQGLAIAALLAACPPRPPSPREGRASSEPGEAARSSAPREEGERWIALRRTRCYGNCPAYAVTLFADGRVSWLGHDHVARVGYASGSADPRAIIDLLERLENADLSGVPSDMPHDRGCATDAPSAVVTARDRTRALRAFDYHGCDDVELQPLRQIEASIDRVADVKRWISGGACPVERDEVFFLDDRADALVGDEPADVWRRKVLESALARLRADPGLSLRLRSAADPAGRAARRIESYRVAFVARGVAPHRIVTWVLDGEGAIDPGGWNHATVVVETGSPACVRVSAP